MPKKLVFKSIVTTDDGNEVVIFHDEMVKIVSAKWSLTVVGYFVRCKMTVHELRCHLRRMW